MGREHDEVKQKVDDARWRGAQGGFYFGGVVGMFLTVIGSYLIDWTTESPRNRSIILPKQEDRPSIMYHKKVMKFDKVYVQKPGSKDTYVPLNVYLDNSFGREGYDRMIEKAKIEKHADEFFSQEDRQDDSQ
tara:strand:- start:61 stop:456 length:396 start_codon:yes stop_codon:yes gene_type:complete